MNRNKQMVARTSQRVAKRAPVTRQQYELLTTGRRLRINPDPATVNLSPWNRLTLVGKPGSGATTGIVTIGDLQSGIQAQLQLGVTSFRVRCERMRAWLTGPSATAAGYPAALSIQPYSFTTGAALADVGDVSGRLDYAAVGYQWSKPDFTIANFSPTSVVHSWRFQSSTADTDILFYYDILWQSNTFVAPTRSLGFMEFGALFGANKNELVISEEVSAKMVEASSCEPMDAESDFEMVHAGIQRQ
jgi:hypothetical protein